MNDTQKRALLITGIIVVLIIAVILWFKLLLNNPNRSSAPAATDSQGISGDAVDITHDFYSAWLERRKATDGGFGAKNPLDTPALSSDMQQKLADFDLSSADGTLDPVLCQTSLPDGLRTKQIFSKDNAAQVLVLSSDKHDSDQAVVTLASHDGLWEITDITCSKGEEAPDTGEFSFDNDGFLLKDSLPDTFDKSHWYVVFEQDGTQGHTAPLLLSSDSTCIDASGNESSCDTGTFTEAEKVHVQGQMTESGVDVKNIQFPSS